MSGGIRPRPAVALLLGLLSSCTRNAAVPPLSPSDSLAVVRDNEAYRTAAHRFFSSDPASPFRADPSAVYTGLRWYPIDPRFRGRSILHRSGRPDTVNVAGTQGDLRTMLRVGWFEFPLPDERGEYLTVRLHAYCALPAEEPLAPGERPHLSVWFTDRTTGIETYPVGRYVNVDNLDSDPGHLYVIDLNKAYNPYCAYSDFFTCAVPGREDHLDLAVRAGEMLYPGPHARRTPLQPEKPENR